MSDELLFKIVMYILPVASFISEFIMLQFSLNMKKKLRQRKENCFVAAKGTIVKVIKKYIRNGDPGWKHMYYPVYEYMADGEQITAKSGYDTYTARQAGTKVITAKSDYGTYTACQAGTQVEVYYNPQNPTEIYVLADKADSVPTALFWGGLLFLFMTVVTLISAVLMDISGVI